MFNFPTDYCEILSDKSSHQELANKGFVVVPFYNDDQLQSLKDLYKAIQPNSLSGMYPSTFSLDESYRSKADEGIKRVASESISRTFKEHKTVAASFIVKYPGANSYMDIHQDMTLLDESTYSGINIWCPIQDVTLDNGVLYVLPRSHRIIPTYRSASIRPLYDKLIVKNAIAKFSSPIEVKAGEAIIFDQSILHFSEANHSNLPRIVTNIFMTHKNAKFQIAYHESSFGNRVELYEQEDGFMTNYKQFGENITDRPKIGRSKGLFEYDFPRLNLNLLKVNYAAQIREISWIDRLRLNLL